jgi:amidase
VDIAAAHAPLTAAEEAAIFIERFASDGAGPTVAIKDTLDVAGTRTRAGSRALDETPPAARDADVVAALRAAGARIVGKTNLHEFAYGVTGINETTGTPRNARFPDRVPGGSSSGSAAAVAAGLVEIAIGTDTGGSIRIPAACCGIVGLKPTYGRVSRVGVMPPVSSLDCVGPFARSVATIERAMAMIDPTFVAEEAPAAFTLGVVAVEADGAIAEALAQALAASGIVQTPVAVDFAGAFDAGLTIISAENAAALGGFADSPLVGADIRARLQKALLVTPEDVAAAERVRARVVANVDVALATCDALVLPTLPIPTLTLDAGRDAAAAIRTTALVRPFNLTGHPAISIPLPARDGYAPGMQLVGRRGGDAALCAIARVMEARIGA